MSVNSPEPDATGQVTEEYIDPKYSQPFVDVNELRDDPMPHRYVHGGFEGSDARFSLYFPSDDSYGGRFFHNTYPMALTSDVGPFPIAFDVATGDLGFTFASGAYYVQTNLGGADRAPPADPAIGAYRVNAAAAKYSREVAAELYGDHRPFGYLFGGSGGSYQVMGAAENTVGVWDGFLPFVLGTPNSIPSVFTVRMHALRVLRCRDKFPGIMDAIDPGGSGDPYVGLDDEERAALEEATLLGYPLRGWWNHKTLTSGYFSNVADRVPIMDPTYVTDFWSKPGYLGGDPTSSIHAARCAFDTAVGAVIESFPMQMELASVPDWDIANAHLVITSGAAAGNSLPVAWVKGATVGFAYSTNPALLHNVAAGDRIRIDNSWPLALETYQHHQVPTPDMYGWNQYRNAHGEPIYPQRGVLVGTEATVNTVGSMPDGRITAKMLAIEALMDVDALPWQADWYRSTVKHALGPRFEDQFALWFIDHAQHDDPATTDARAHSVSYAGALQQGLRDLSTWVERGVKPPDTVYEVIDTQVHVPAAAAHRGGIQPVVELKVHGGVRAEVGVGEPVSFDATVEVPPNAGDVIAAEWDFEGVGTYPVVEQLGSPRPKVVLSATHVYTQPGTYFAVLRGTSQRQGDTRTPYGRVQNLARVRVIVR
jgi:hypothetical protein